MLTLESWWLPVWGGVLHVRTMPIAQESKQGLTILSYITKNTSSTYLVFTRIQGLACILPFVHTQTKCEAVEFDWLNLSVVELLACQLKYTRSITCII